MKKLVLNFTIGSTTSTDNAKSEANMWNILRKVRNNLSDQNLQDGARCQVFTEDGTLFKDITFRRNSKGKIEMPNAVKETCRRHMDKVRAEAKKAAARKAKKAEANRRYRARLKARKAAEKVAVMDKAA